MKNIIAILMTMIGWVGYAQPSCTSGATKLDSDGKLYGCVEGVWRKLTEETSSNVAIGSTKGTTQNVNGVVYAREANNSIYQLNNIGFTPISIPGQTHEVGKIIYVNQHFYQGVTGGKWHEIDNPPIPYGAITVNGTHLKCENYSRGTRFETNVGWFRTEIIDVPSPTDWACDFVLEGDESNFQYSVCYETIDPGDTCYLVIGRNGSRGVLTWVKPHVP